MAGLPLPSDEDWLRSQRLEQDIKERIRQRGAVSFAAFMESVLYDPKLGYYTATQEKFGASGDFTTAPNISPLFSQCVANQCCQVLENMVGGTILEMGAGNGQMACDILLFLEKQAFLPEKYIIIECSESLQAMQKESLATQAPHLLHRVQWVDEIPKEFKGVIVGNELLDAMPAERIRWSRGRYWQAFVNLDKQGYLQEVYLPIDDSELLQTMQYIATELPYTQVEGQCMEVNTVARRWLQEAAQCMQAGLVLLIDYGYPQQEFYHPQRMDGTRTCFYRHYRHNNPFILPGLQDISCHVDFTAMTEVAVNNGMELSGFCNQAGFLMGCGLTELMAACQQAMDEDDLKGSIIFSNQMDKLLAPGEMGELVKAIGFQKGLEVSMQGFSLQDVSFRL